MTASNLNIEDLTKNIDALEQEAQALDAEYRLLDILTPLLEAEGYSVEHKGGPGDGGIDYLAKQTDPANSELPTTMGIQYKHFKSLVGASSVQQIIGVSILNNLDRMILLSRPFVSQYLRQLPVLN